MAIKPEAPEAVIARIAAERGLTVADITGKRRHGPLVAARAEVAASLRADGLTLMEIGAALGGRDHSTVLHLLKLAELPEYGQTPTRTCARCGKALFGKQRRFCSERCNADYHHAASVRRHRERYTERQRERRAAERAARDAA